MSKLDRALLTFLVILVITPLKGLPRGFSARPLQEIAINPRESGIDDLEFPRGPIIKFGPFASEKEFERHLMCKDVSADWEPIFPTTTFMYNDEKAVCLMTVYISNKMETFWYYRSSSTDDWELYGSTEDYVTTSGWYSYWVGLPISGEWPGQNYPKGWAVDVYIDDSYAFSDYFEVTDGGLSEDVTCEDVQDGEPVGTKDTFIKGVDSRVQHYLRLDHVAYYNQETDHCHDLMVVWYAPNGSIYRTYTSYWSDYKDLNPSYDYWGSCYVGHDYMTLDPSVPEGSWRIETYLDQYYDEGTRWYGPISTITFEVVSQEAPKIRVEPKVLDISVEKEGSSRSCCAICSSLGDNLPEAPNFDGIRRYRTGCLPETPDQRVEKPVIAPDQLPSSFDWRNKDGANWMTSVKDQGSCGSCVAFATIGAFESVIRIKENNPYLPVDLSEQHIFSCGGGSCEGGWYISAALDYLQEYGAPDEPCFPYQAADAPCWESCDDWQERAKKIRNWFWLSDNRWILKGYLTRSPLIARMDIYEDFYYYSGGVYEHTWGDLEDGHAVVIVGYNDSESCWICKNSWGSSWGENGYFRIKYGECGIEDCVAFIEYEPSQTNSFTVYNDGNQELTVNIQSDSTWLSASPASFSVPSIGSETVIVNVDPSGLDVGDYTGTLTVYSNDPSETPVVTVNLHVFGAPSSRNYWAIICGVADYPGTINDLEYPDDDAIAMRDTLVNNQGWNPDNIILLLNSEATKSAIQNAISTIGAQDNPEDVVLFYFSGHGTHYSDSYPYDEVDGYDEAIVAYDLDISDDELESWMDALDSNNKVVILDTCFSGGFMKSGGLRAKTLPGVERADIKDGFVKDIDKAGYVVLAASDDDEYSYEDSILKHGVFTYYLLQGLGSGFPADSNEDNSVSAEEAFEYARPRVESYTSNDQHPQLYDGVPGEVNLTTGRGNPDLVVEDLFWSPVQPYDGCQVKFTAVISNLGDENAQGPFKVSYYVDDIKMGEWIINELAPGDNVTEYFTWTATGGDHVVKVFADSDDYVPESNENNNIREESVHVSHELPEGLTINGLLSIDYYSLYQYETKDLVVGLSRYGELIRNVDDLGLEYGQVDPFAPPAGSEGSIPPEDWVQGWLINISYTHATYGQRNVWACALHSDTLAYGGSWLRVDFPGDWNSTYGWETPDDPGYILNETPYMSSGLIYGGRKTNGTAITLPYKVIYDGPRKIVVELTTLIFDHFGYESGDTSSDLPLVKVVITLTFNKVKKQVVITKDVKSIAPSSPVVGKLKVQFSDRGGVYLGTESFGVGYDSYVHFYTAGNEDPYNDNVNEGIQTVYGSSWGLETSPPSLETLHGPEPNGEPDTFDLCQVINERAGYVWYAAFWPSLSDWTVDGWDIWFRSMDAGDPHKIDLDAEPDVPFYIGEWDFELDDEGGEDIQFRALTIYGIVDKHNADDADMGAWHSNVLDEEVLNLLDEELNPWDLRSALDPSATNSVWIIVGRDARPVDCIGASEVRSAMEGVGFSSWNSGQDMMDLYLVPWVMSPLSGVPTGSGDREVYYDPYEEDEGPRAALRDYWTSVPISGSYLVALGGPRANLLTEYLNDFLPAVYNGTHLIALSCWSKNSFAHPAIIPSDVHYAVIGTYKDLNGTMLLTIWGLRGEDTHWASVWLRESLEGVLGCNLQLVKEGAVAIILRLDYSNYGIDQRPEISIYEVLGTFSETCWSSCFFTSCQFQEPPHPDP